MSLAKLPFILIDAIGMRIAATPPNPPLPVNDHIIPDWREHFLKRLALPSKLLRGIYWSAGLIEIVVILASQNSSGPISRYLLQKLVLNGTSQNIRFTPLFFLGNIITLSGTILRIRCYRTLGQFFTFELCIKENHILIVEGPYAIIRHPSYTGLILTIIGAYCSNITGSWVKECGILSTCVGRILLSVWIFIAASVILSLILRIPREDQILRKRFGDEWDKWVERVPYKLIPGVY